MRRVSIVIASAVVGLLAAPSWAWAEGALSGPARWAGIAVSLAGLVIAIILLVEALGVRKIALGGAIAEKISYVLLAIVLLACSALVEWTSYFVMYLPTGQAQLISEAFVIAAMALLAAYFYSVRTAMQGFLNTMDGQEGIAQESSVAPADAGSTQTGQPDSTNGEPVEPGGATRG